MVMYRALLVNGGTYTTPEPEHLGFSAYYHEPTGWHLESLDDARFHMVVDGDGEIWSLPVAIIGGGRAVGEMCWDLAEPMDWTVDDLTLYDINPEKPHELVVRDARRAVREQAVAAGTAFFHCDNDVCDLVRQQPTRDPEDWRHLSCPDCAGPVHLHHRGQATCVK